MAKRIAVVISQGQSANPAKRRLEEDIVTALLMEPGIDVTVIPHLYDMKGDATGALALQGITGDLILLSWLYERAARWTLDRHGVRGLAGRTLIAPPEEAEDDDLDDDGEGDDGKGDEAAGGSDESVEGSGAAGEKTRVADARQVPQRRIYCIDLRVDPSAARYVDEVRRIAAEVQVELVQLGGWIEGRASEDQLRRYVRPANDTALPLAPSLTPDTGGDGAERGSPSDLAARPREATRIVDEPDRRWYPVIDYGRCTNCMECIDFCLFGVYGVDRAETILVEQPDNCRKGCPACSRVCPENAIIFPQHKTPAIAGAPVGLVSLKIDLSKLFGAPEQGRSAIEMAALERDEQLVMVGRQPVGMSVGMPKRQDSKSPAPRDELDELLDQLDDANL
jgi:NAD-dependent dihydropyrimidine dehydrogenase PreA subunit